MNRRFGTIFKVQNLEKEKLNKLFIQQKENA